ncbi:hypothetical protein sphantq_00896 [Sphingobium sp. AntQ-1]|nr:hypothetical protein sphantq_00896 [Sphingobium sp. AntQ-1]
MTQKGRTVQDAPFKFDRDRDDQSSFALLWSWT